MKVFVSSVIGGMEPFRDAAVKAIRSLGHEATRAEDFGAAPGSPQQVCLAGVRESEAVVLLLGERYGQIQPSGLSPTHEEFREARERIPVLVFVQLGVSREPKQQQFVDEVGAWSSGYYRASFSTTEDLRDAVTRALHDLDVAKARGSADEREMLERARQLVPRNVRQAGPLLSVIVTGGPAQSVLRPAELDNEQLIDDLTQVALRGTSAVFTVREGTNSQVSGRALVLTQQSASAEIDEQGSIRVIMATRDADRGWPLTGVPSVIEEDVEERIERALKFAAAVLDRIDQPQRISDVVPIAAILDAGFMPWRTRAEHTTNPNSAHMPMGREDTIIAELAPASRKRAALSQDAARLAEDLTVIIRRRMLQT